MLSVCIWIIAAMAVLCLMVFPGKRSGTLNDSGNGIVIDAAKDFTALSLLMMLILYPLYSGNYHGFYKYYDLFVRDHNYDLPSSLPSYLKSIRYLRIEMHDDISFGLRNGIYALILSCSVFLFFAGMYVYKFGLKIRHKLLLIIPSVMTVFGVACLVRSHTKIVSNNPLPTVYSMIVYQSELFVEYLMSTIVMVVILYLVYKILKLILQSEAAALVVILVLSCFPSEYQLMQGVQDPNLLYFVLGANIPLFPVGMIVMKYKDKLLPKSLKRTVIWAAVWTGLGTASFITLAKMQSFCIEKFGVYIPRVGCVIDGVTGAQLDKAHRFIIKVSRFTAIPWLILGLSIVMLFLLAAIRIGTGNKFTVFIRKHIFIILILNWCQYIFRYDNYVDPVSDLLVKIKIENKLISSTVSLLTAFGFAIILNRFVLDKIKVKHKEKQKDKKEIVVSRRTKTIRNIAIILIASTVLGYAAVSKGMSINGLWISLDQSYVAVIEDGTIDIYGIDRDGKPNGRIWAGSIEHNSGTPLTDRYIIEFNSLRASLCSGSYRQRRALPQKYFADVALGTLTIKDLFGGNLRFVRTSAPYDECVSRTAFCDDLYDETSLVPSFARGRYWKFSGYSEGNSVRGLIAVEITNNNPYSIEVPTIRGSWPQMELIDSIRLYAYGTLRPGETAIVICESSYELPSGDITFSLITPEHDSPMSYPDAWIEATDISIETDGSGKVTAVDITYEAYQTTVNVVEVIFYNGDEVVGVAYTTLLSDAVRGDNMFHLDHITDIREDEYDRVEVQIL